MTNEDVCDKASFVAYLSELRVQLEDGRAVRAWANLDLPSFFEGMEAWVHAWTKPAQPNPWRHVADVITAATVYE